jgi:hypothetical protein
MMELKNPIKMSKIGKRMSPPIPLVMMIIILFDSRMEPSWCFIGHKDSHPNLHRREKIILDSHWFMKDEGAIDWREGFPNFHWTRRASSRGVLEVYQGGRRISYVLGKKEEGEWKCEKEISFLCVERCC